MKYRFIFFILAYSSFLYATENSYGWNIHNSSLNIGGYLDMTYDSKREEEFLFNDIAMMFSSNNNRFDLLGEIELSHISVDGNSNNSSDIDLKIERLELTYALSDDKSIKIGRFNSDIGYWNQAPISILEDTTTEPYIVKNFFPKATTGIHYHQDINRNSSFSITFQKNNDISHQDNNIAINRHFALAYYGEKEEFSWRLSLGKYLNDSSIDANYIGIGSQYDGDKLVIQAEIFTKNSDDDNNKNLYSAYLQSTWNIKDKHDAIFRFEEYKDNTIETKEQIYLLGYSYRPSKNIVLKSEYIYHQKLPLNRFVYSISVLF